MLLHAQYERSDRTPREGATITVVSLPRPATPARQPACLRGRVQAPRGSRGQAAPLPVHPWGVGVSLLLGCSLTSRMGGERVAWGCSRADALKRGQAWRRASHVRAGRGNGVPEDGRGARVMCSPASPHRPRTAARQLPGCFCPSPPRAALACLHSPSSAICPPSRPRRRRQTPPPAPVGHGLSSPAVALPPRAPAANSPRTHHALLASRYASLAPSPEQDPRYSRPGLLALALSVRILPQPGPIRGRWRCL